MRGVLDEIRDSLAWAFESTKSIEVKLHQELVYRVPPPDLAYSIIDEHYIDDMNQHKFYDVEYKNGDAVLMRTRNYQNGPKSAYVSFDEKQPDIQRSIIVKRDFGREDKSDRLERPKPILYWYVGRTPLHQAIDKAEYGGVTKVGGSEAHVFIFKQVKWFVPQDQVYYIDATARTPIKVAAYRNTEDRAAEKPLWVWSALKIEDVQGHAIPVASETLSYSGSDGSIELTTKHEVLSMKFNESYPASTFWPQTQPGVGVLDALTNKVSVTPGANPADEGPTTAVVGVVASPGLDAIAVASWVSAGLGVSVLLAGAVLWRRRGKPA